jgi:hypothetical protein
MRGKIMQWQRMMWQVVLAALLAAAQSPGQRNSIGMNLTPANEADPLKLFADAVKSARGFASYDNHAVPTTLDANGWPLTDAGVVLWNMPGNVNGTYKLYLTTQNAGIDARAVTVAYQTGGGWGTAAIGNKVYSATNNTGGYDVVVADTN